MITTPDLINSLAVNVTPVRRLRPPLTRAASWLLVAALVIALLAVSQGIRADLLERLRDPIFAIAMAATLLTAILATISAFMVSLPDRSRFWPLLPIPAAIVWLSSIGYQCLTNWVDIGPGGIAPGEQAGKREIGAGGITREQNAPSIDIQRSGTRREELLLDEGMLRQVWTMRRMVSMLGGSEGTELVLSRLAKTQSNAEFLDTLNRDI